MASNVESGTVISCVDRLWDCEEDRVQDITPIATALDGERRDVRLFRYLEERIMMSVDLNLLYSEE